MPLVQIAISFALSLLSFVVMAAIIEAMRLRGFDPIARLARIAAPAEPLTPSETSEA